MAYAYVLVFYHYTKNGVVADPLGVHSTLWKAKMDLISFVTSFSSPIPEYSSLYGKLRRKGIDLRGYKQMDVPKLTSLLYNEHSILLRDCIPHNIYKVSLGTFFDFSRLPYTKTFYNPKEKLKWEPRVFDVVESIFEGRIMGPC